MRLSIGELASMTGETVKTLRYYTDLGLLEAQRGDNKYRYYRTEVVRRVTLIRQMQALGLSLREIQDIVALRSEGLEPCDEVREQIGSRLTNVRDRIEELRKLEVELATRLQWATAHPDAACNDEATICVYLSEPEETLQP
jgi:MerR family copper efflux transcriptional regulator